MVFSSNLFIFGVAPVFFVFYFLLPAFLRNAALLLFGLAFYAFGTGPLVSILIFSVVLNYGAALLIERSTSQAWRRVFFWTAAALNLIFLIYYKYAGFFWDVASDALGGNLHLAFARPDVQLPIGISFFTFQALSYVADVYTRHSRAARSLIDFGAYHTLFPQLIAGPIVRYAEIDDEIKARTTRLDEVAAGLSRFAIGLAKKVIIADNAGAIADVVFNAPPDQVSTAVAWVGVVAYSIQILFDFSGYSDMAIGMGRMLGFHFPENFERPYQSRSITEFWRRWHMTLSRWFRDYVYIPLGGNRAGPIRTYFNLFIVFVLCGLWHGAAYTFVIWGIFHGLLLVAERLLKTHVNFAPAGLAGQAYTLLMVMVGWTIFRAGSLGQAGDILARMFVPHGSGSSSLSLLQLLEPSHAVFVVIGVLIAVFEPRFTAEKIGTSWLVAGRMAAFLLFTYAVLRLSSGTFNPFIYFRF